MIFVESEVVELKSKIVSDICKEIIAFANTKGGTLYIGIEDDGNVVGIEDCDRVTLQLTNMIRDSIKPDITMFVRYETLSVDDKNIIVVTLSKNETDENVAKGIARNLKVSKVSNISIVQVDRDGNDIHPLVLAGTGYLSGSAAPQN